MNFPKNQQETADLRVAGGSEAAKIAGALVKKMQAGYRITLSAMGAAAVNQAVKAICIARGMVAPQGWSLGCVPGFVDEVVDGVTKTAIRLYVHKL